MGDGSAAASGTSLRLKEKGLSASKSACLDVRQDIS